MIGTGILKGMAVTARNFVGSYFDKERLITVQYPEERIPLPENYRNFPFLVYDATIRKRGYGVWRARFARRNVRRNAFTSLRAKTRSPITWVNLNFTRKSSTSMSRFA